MTNQYQNRLQREYHELLILDESSTPADVERVIAECDGETLGHIDITRMRSMIPPLGWRGISGSGLVDSELSDNVVPIFAKYNTQ